FPKGASISFRRPPNSNSVADRGAPLSASPALVIIYNHQYDENIERLEHLYKRRFGSIFHLVPFYRGSRSNVVPVYENSHYFQGYIAQAFRAFFREDFSHY